MPTVTQEPVPSVGSFGTLERKRVHEDPGNQFQYPALHSLAAPHIDSFNAIFEGTDSSPSWISTALTDIPPKAVYDHSKGAKSAAYIEDSDEEGLGEQTPVSKLGNRIQFWIDSVELMKPMANQGGDQSSIQPIYPSESRDCSTSYQGKLQAKVCWRVNHGPVLSEVRSMGYLPVMVKSNRCNTEFLSPKEHIRHREESEDFGGYFVINGNEKIVRLLIAQRRNYIMGINRPTFSDRGPAYTTYGTSMRCVRPDQTSSTMTLHYLNNGVLTLRFYIDKREYLVPFMLILRSLVDTSDRDVFLALVRGDVENTFLTERIELLLRSFSPLGLFTQQQCLEYLGIRFHSALSLPEEYTPAQIGREVLRQFIAVHLTDNKAKFNVLVTMAQKLYTLVAGECSPDNADSAQNQELLLPGQLYTGLLKESLEGYLENVLFRIRHDVSRGSRLCNFSDPVYVTRILNRSNPDVGRKLHYFLSTGNLVSRTGLDLLQSGGFVIIAERINFLRYLAHFRCVHRGAFFTEMKTTTVRKLRPESWGFLCPVHTPDGSPCGLLNHLSYTCRISHLTPDVSKIPGLLVSLGMSQILNGHVSNSDHITVQLDGRVIGYCSAHLAVDIARKLRHLKVTKRHNLPLDMEIGYVPVSRGGQYPGLYLFTTPCRMVRPVKYLSQKASYDMVGSFEQVYMDIACVDEDVIPNVSTHQEYAPTYILSVLANMTPFSDFNPSPRNMYQCQMGKQTMGTPAQAIRCRSDNKLYVLQTGQTPIVRSRLHNVYAFDEYPNGTNACVAVISYTGYDMEDAMILNKSGHERGFAYGSVYKSELVDLTSHARRGGGPVTLQFGLGEMEEDSPARRTLDIDGLPFVGARLKAGDAFYAYYDTERKRTVVKSYKGPEEGYVDSVRLLGQDDITRPLQRIKIVVRIPRAPLIGDKFSSRHGQKGVCSQKWPSVDMPFSESGVQPDVIINPHAFPSRMTIGMFVESMAAKAGAMHGVPQDSTPFQFSEDYTASEHFGEQLAKAGFNYYGNEPMYSGITGKEFEADIYFGVVYYQRLRHMVNDKFQVRSTGTINPLTRQPIKGRKRAGGIRFGEMERDSLIAHGTAYLLQDRLLHCSDYCQTHVCKLCGSIVSPVNVPSAFANPGSREFNKYKSVVECKVCATADGITVISLPFVFKYLASELGAMNIRMTLKVD
ncbi:hypothetical protein IWQ61_007273 [Dispira simplex]|nr:hypothetical protein IWQ61_007273 [Dispira simplex]